MAQGDRDGNVNVSKFGSGLAGAGGFINISQNARKVVFVGSFNTGAADVAIEAGRLLLGTGSTHKFVDAVEHRTFSGSYARQRQQTVLYVTERCVFKMGAEGLELLEIAPGVDLERDILGQMSFLPVMQDTVPLMDARIFVDEPMGLRDQLLRLPLTVRIRYDHQQDTLFVNLAGITVRNSVDVAEIKRLVESEVGGLGRKVLVVDYDNFGVLPDVHDVYWNTVTDLSQRFHSNTIRYTTSAFMRAKLGAALGQRGLSPHVFESAAESSPRSATPLVKN